MDLHCHVTQFAMELSIVYALFPSPEKIKHQIYWFCIIYQQKIHIKQEINAQIISLQKNTTSWPGVSVVQLD